MPDRRQVILQALAAGFALSVRPLTAETLASTIVTDDQGLMSGNGMAGADGTLPLYFARPKNSLAAPIVLVVSEIFGVHAYIRDVCRRLAHMGYFAVAPELFYRQGDPQNMTDIQQILRTITSQTPDAQALDDLDQTVLWASKQGGNVDKLAITGFCWGGRITWLYAAHRPKLRAAVAWYGRLYGAKNSFNPSYPGDADIIAHLHCPVLGLYGGLDNSIPVQDVEAMRAALAAANTPAAQKSRIEVYDNASHAFHADYRASYRKEDAEAAWQELTQWFATYLD